MKLFVGSYHSSVEIIPWALFVCGYNFPNEKKTEENFVILIPASLMHQPTSQHEQTCKIEWSVYIRADKMNI